MFIFAKIPRIDEVELQDFFFLGFFDERRTDKTFEYFWENRNYVDMHNKTKRLKSFGDVLDKSNDDI